MPSVTLISAWVPGAVTNAEGFQYIELTSPPAAAPANDVPKNAADCSGTAKPPAIADPPQATISATLETTLCIVRCAADGFAAVGLVIVMALPVLLS
jgi:hypothetical protein